MPHSRIAFSLALLSALFFSNAAFACICEPFEIKNVARNDVIFSGKVVDQKDSADGKSINISFEIPSTWKGATRQVVSTSKYTSMCGASFDTGKTYIVFASKRGDHLSTTSCAENISTEGMSQEELTQLESRIREALK